MRTPRFAALAACLALTALAAPAAVGAAPSGATVGRGTVRVLVTEGGEPVPRARITYTHWRYADRLITTGSDGVATVRLPAGRWHAYAGINREHGDDPLCWDRSAGDLVFSVATGQTRRLVVDLDEHYTVCA
jgi:hypothetical protein